MKHTALLRYQQITGDSPEKILKYTTRPCLRVNTLKISVEKLKTRLEAKEVRLEPVPYLANAFWYSSRFSLGATEEYLLGYYYLQETASQLPIHAASKIKNIRDKIVLDIAAAPGSKTTQLASCMNNSGTIIAVDQNRQRAQALGNNLERCGVTNTFVYQKDGRYIADFKMKFDVILLDAPCSGNFCSDNKWFRKRKITDFADRAQLQHQLLKAAIDVCKKGGLIIYSTCSLEPEENEGVLTKALEKNHTILPLNLQIGDPGLQQFSRNIYRNDCVNAVRLWPHKHQTQGFFLAAIEIN